MMLNVSPRPARRRPLLTAALALTVALGAALAGRADAQTPTPRHGGNLVLAITSEPDTLDCHAGTSFTVVHHLAPHYSFLLRYDPDRFPAVVGDLAEGWSVSPDGLVYTFRIRDGVRFHDGTPLTAADVAASYERLRNPPTGVISVRRSEFESIGAIEVPDPRTVVFRLRYPDASLLAGFASPWNCIYSAARLAADPTYPQREVMGSGPFRFVARQPGTEWRGERFDHYYVAGQPYLDSFRLVYMAPAAIPNALQGGVIHGELRFMTPPQRDRLVAALGDRVTVTEGPLVAMVMVAFNTQKAPFDDVRVRRALALAIDRPGGAAALARTSVNRYAGGLFLPASPYDAPRDVAAQWPGYGPDIEANRAEARRLLREAGQSGLRFRLINRNQQEPYVTAGVYVIDQWRRVGVTVEQELLLTPQHLATLTAGNYDVALDATSTYVDEPSQILAKFLSFDVAPAPLNTARYIDREIDELYAAQRRAVDSQARLGLLRRLENRVLSEAYFAPLYWGQRIVVTSTALRGWRALPSHFLNQSLASVWLER